LAAKRLILQRSLWQSDWGLGSQTIDSVLKEDYQLGGYQIKGVLMSPQTQKPADDEKLVLVAWRAAVEAAGALSGETACRDKSTWDGIAKVRMELQTGKAGEFAFKEIPAGQFAVFVLRPATRGLPGQTTAGRLVGLPILREQGQHAIARFVMSDAGQPSNITMWIVDLPLGLRSSLGSAI
jgi:hypothetical protein